MPVQSGGIGPALVRVLTAAQPDLMAELLAPGRTLEADVVAVFQNRAVLAFGRGLRLEVALQAELKEGQRVKVQVQPRAAAAVEGSSPPAVILKLISEADGRNLQIQGQTTTAPGPHAQAEAPAAFWLPIPLPDGRQGWAQLQVREEPEGTGPAHTGKAARQVRLWWETPALGQVQVVLDAAAGSLAANFTLPGEAARQQVEQALPALKQQLSAAGFAEVRVGARRPRTGEHVGPSPAGGASILDRRL